MMKVQFLISCLTICCITGLSAQVNTEVQGQAIITKETTIGSSDFIGTLSVKDVGTTNPVLYLSGGSNTEGDITFPENETLQIGTWGTDSVFTNLMQLKANGELKLADLSGTSTGAVVADADGTLSRSNDLVTKEFGFTGNGLLNAIINDEEYLFCELELQGTSSGNVMQGFAVDNKNREIYTTHRYGTSPEISIINKFSYNGSITPTNEGYSNEIFLGHSQDLSIEYINNDEIRLWTQSSTGRGVARINYNGNTSTFVEYELISETNLSGLTPTVSLNGKYIVARVVNDNDKTNDDRIYIFLRENIINGDFTPLNYFTLHPDQMVTDQWFQGIACDNDIIYCLTGNSSIDLDKLLYAYSFDGKLLFAKTLTTGKTDAANTGDGTGWEPEGLSIYHPNNYTKAILVGIVSGNPGDRTKRVYSLGSQNGVLEVNGDEHPNDVGLYFAGGAKDISYNQTHALQIGQMDNSIWTERARFTSSGKFGLGTTNPSTLLQVGENADGTYALANSWNVFSDKRLKTDIYRVENSIQKLKNINGYHYSWKNNTSIKDIGVMAQEVEPVFPELVKTGEDGIKSVDYSKLTAVLINALNEQQEMIHEMKLRIDHLEKNQSPALKQADTED